MRLLSIFAAILLAVTIPRSSLAQARVESNVVYGMYSGLALLMDVHYPENPNGYGIVSINGSGFHAPLSLDAEPLKQSEGLKGTLGANATGASFFGEPLRGSQLMNPQSEEYQLYMEASPTSYVSPDDPPFLLIHGDADTVVPFGQSELFQVKLIENGIIVELIRVPGGGHGLSNSEGRSPSDHFGRIVEWFDRHL